MKYASRMKILKSFAELVYDEANMNIFKDTLGYYIMKIGLHVFEE